MPGPAASKPLVVEIPHDLGKAEATRRLQQGLGAVKSRFSAHIASFDEAWTDNRMSFRVGALGQVVAGTLDVLEDRVRVEIALPWILRVIAEKARGFVEKQGQLLLEKK
jgi:hypothetical protein